MILNCGVNGRVFVSPVRRIVLMAATSFNTDHLRTQLDHLHSEAQNTRAKANNARLRLMRLSEAAEKLQRQAVISVRTGKEDDARQLLFQKKKVMQALEKSKNRIELLDELSAKLNKAISVKETQLVGTVALDLEGSTEEASSPVRIVSPKEEGLKNTDENEDFDDQSAKLDEDKKMQVYTKGLTDLPADDNQNNLEGSLIGANWNETDAVSSLKGLSSYEDFLEHLDQQLSNIEAELVTFLRFSTLVLDGDEKPKNSKVQKTRELLEIVGRIRGRIASIMQEKVPTR